MLLRNVHFYLTLRQVHLLLSINIDIGALLYDVRNVCAFVWIYLFVVGHLGCFSFLVTVTVPW